VGDVMEAKKYRLSNDAKDSDKLWLGIIKKES